ncbi:hypothetical protein DDB_G0269604 [Dictyostelium discoideum AX4]|uniref:Uncharacterized protein n=1 Tax=Dictyostelium discoideum TaxID=44689 RepID=Q55DM3_DICDI|nr:hypothetical protein DDB_G0269604 [Dictyostelium discoideum AX4]EAL72152.1 hypothetical protein DDB_G0269604 [Dictyostelium discoideum AX4]|eukprot:XP_646108.1 hypothetical protein DDB_G0269604 [Dictyostelium discoideum AX4]
MMLPFCGNMQYDHTRMGEIPESNSVLFYQMKYYGEINDVSKKENLTSSFGYYDRYFKKIFLFSKLLYMSFKILNNNNIDLNFQQNLYDFQA